MHHLVVFCNPLLDVILSVDVGFLAQHNLRANDQILAMTPEHASLVDAVTAGKHGSVQFGAGGAGQNTARAASWLLTGYRGECQVHYCGAVGKDESAQELAVQAGKTGIHAEYIALDSEPTGSCLCLLNDSGRNRSLLARLGAARCFNQALTANPECRRTVRNLVSHASLLYITGFFLSSCSRETLLSEIFANPPSPSTLITMNLSAAFLCGMIDDPEILSRVDVMFGNEAEVLAWHAHHTGTKDAPASVEEAARLLSRSVCRLVVITQGSQDTLVVFSDSEELIRVPVNPVSSIVDTNGGGDAFVAGFLAWMLVNCEDPLSPSNVTNACLLGHAMAAYIISRVGVSFDPDAPASLPSFLT